MTEKALPTREEFVKRICATAFSAPPSQPALRLLSRLDAGLRQFVRRIKPDGLGPMDVYEGPPR